MEPYDMKKKPIDQTAEEMLAAFEINPDLYMGMWGHKPTADEVRDWLIRTGSYPKDGTTEKKPVKSNWAGVTLWRLRNKRGLTIRQLSKKSNVSRSQINRIENGEITPTAETLSKLAAALKVSVKEFLGPER